MLLHATLYYLGLGLLFVVLTLLLGSSAGLPGSWSSDLERSLRVRTGVRLPSNEVTDFRSSVGVLAERVDDERSERRKLESYENDDEKPSLI